MKSKLYIFKYNFAGGEGDEGRDALLGQNDDVGESKARHVKNKLSAQLKYFEWLFFDI